MIMSSSLILNNVGKRFGDFWVLRNVRASVPTGKITAFIGPNGAGKTTLFHVIAGTLKPDEGKVTFRGTDITGQPAFAIARLGIGRQFQDVRVFGGLTVRDNVIVGMLPPSDRDAWQAWVPSHRRSALMETFRAEAAHWLEHVGLQDRMDQMARDLSFGQQKLLALARLFAKRSDLLLLDEPTAGLSHSMIEQITKLIRQAVTERGLTVVLVEHNMNVVADLASWIHFMHEGRVAFSGEKDHVLGNRSVREIYMGL